MSVFGPCPRWYSCTREVEHEGGCHYLKAEAVALGSDDDGFPWCGDPACDVWGCYGRCYEREGSSVAEHRSDKAGAAGSSPAPPTDVIKIAIVMPIPVGFLEDQPGKMRP